MISKLTDNSISNSKIDLSNENLQFLIENSPYGLCYTTRKGEFLYTNKYYQQMIGYSDKELLNMRFFDITHPEDLHTNKDLIKQAIQTLGTAKFQKRYITKSQKIIHVRIIVKATTNTQGEVFLIALAEDITELIDYKNRLEQSEINLIRSQRMNAVSELSGALIHDFNNILATINGYLFMINNELSPNAVLQSYIDGITSTIQSATEITSQLEIANTMEVFNKQTLNLGDLVLSLKNNLLALVRNHATLEFRINPDCYIFADITQVEQILMNLVINAKHAIEKNGTIIITVEKTNQTLFGLIDYVKLVIRDNGHGIPEEYLPFVFEPYFTTKRDDGGTGIGLTSVYRIVKDLEGEIDISTQVKSVDNSNSFTEFIIHIPAYVKVNRKQTFELNEKEGGLNQEFRIALVDDNTKLNEVMENTIGNMYSLVTYTNPSEIDITHLARFDLIISDIAMPQMSGTTLVTEVRKINPDIPVIFISGYTVEKIDQLTSTKNTWFLKKVFDMNDLIQLIELVKELPSKNGS